MLLCDVAGLVTRVFVALVFAVFGLTACTSDKPTRCVCVKYGVVVPREDLREVPRDVLTWLACVLNEARRLRQPVTRRNDA
jgi:hypothetical protein